METVRSFLVMETRTRTKMEFVDPVFALSEEEASKKAIKALGFSYNLERNLQTRTAIEILDSLGHYIEEVKV